MDILLRIHWKADVPFHPTVPQRAILKTVHGKQLDSIFLSYTRSNILFHSLGRAAPFRAKVCRARAHDANAATILLLFHLFPPAFSL